MSRLPDLPYEAMTAEQRRVHDEIAAGPRGKVEGPLRVWLHVPELATHAQKLGAHARFHSLLPPPLSELAILVTAAAWRSDFEWYAHARLAREAGIADNVIEAIQAGEKPSLPDDKARAVYAVARELHTTRALSDETYAIAEAALGHAALVDLVGILGYYTLVSMTLNAFRVPTPDGSQPFAD
ncbi:MAG TPA: carboxymuconolactone decarboxylase family protein [Geminicoccaceae bacterium]|nr:carboxymuconolactone decarboxylase family protein [Geminicoccaceae bacterium]